MNWITTAGPPRIMQQPVSQTVAQGASVTLSVSAVGAGPMSYQWLCNNSPLAGATNSTLTLDNVRTNDTGNYIVVLVNPPGSLTSAVAVVTVMVPPSLSIQPASNPGRPGGGVTLSVGATGTPVINYAIQTTTNLASANWTTIATSSPTNGTFSFTDTNATDQSRFYRAVMQ